MTGNASKHSQWQTTHLHMAILVLISFLFSVAAAPTVQADPVRYYAQSWTRLERGLEVGVYFPPDTRGAVLSVVRIDPTYFTFRVHYQPDTPLSREGWRDTLPDAVAIVNGGFFDNDHRPRGLIVADGVPFGTSLQDRGGMLQVVEGRLSIRALFLPPLDPAPDSSLEQAVQAYPMLVSGGVGTYAVPSQRDRAARRTAAAVDQAGRLLLIVTPASGILLSDLSQFLPKTDLQIVSALNLDGGGSTLLDLSALTGDPIAIDSHYPVPVVIATYSRPGTIRCLTVWC